MDPIKLYRTLSGLPRFVKGWLDFRRSYSGQMKFFPCLQDLHDKAGATENEYFWQDLYVARKVCGANPEKHVDVGSRIDGFVSSVASFREIEVVDIRPLPDIPGIIFRQADLTIDDPSLSDHCDSLSCLHALEHFGLGRYGDRVNSEGHKTALKNMARMLVNEGTFYLSTPIGRERVEFNGHRVFDPRSLVEIAGDYGLRLKELACFEGGRAIRECQDPGRELDVLREFPYVLGIFTFQKLI